MLDMMAFLALIQQGSSNVLAPEDKMTTILGGVCCHLVWKGHTHPDTLLAKSTKNSPSYKEQGPKGRGAVESVVKLSQPLHSQRCVQFAQVA